MFKPGESLTIHVPEVITAERLDLFLQKNYPDYSRSFFQELIRQEAIKINGRVAKKTGSSIKAHDVITLDIPVREEKPTLDQTTAAQLGIETIYTCPEFAIINKPAGLVVHAPHKNSTSLALTDWLTTQFKNIETVGYADRPGIVHRLDKDTSGLMIIPLTACAHAHFSALFKEHKIKKTYHALVQGHPEKQGVVDLAIGRDPQARIKMATIPTGRKSTTAYEVITYFDKEALVELQPTTGRTHQIRVHMKALGHPLLGDTVYGTTSIYIKRHALHAIKLAFSYLGKEFTFQAPLPSDFKEAIRMLNVHVDQKSKS